MSIPAGMLNKPVRLYKRAPMPSSLMGVRGGFVPLEFVADHWGAFRAKAAEEYRIGGMTLTGNTGVLTLRDNPTTRSLSAANRAMIDGVMYDIQTVQEGERREGILRCEVRAAPTKEAYAREMESVGDVAVVRRVLIGGSNQDIPARAIITGFQPDEIAGGIIYGERRVILLAEDVAKNSWPVPPKVNDKILIQGGTRSLNVMTVDDETHRFAGELYAYEIRASG